MAAVATWKPWHRQTLPIKTASILQCTAWSFQLPYVPIFVQDNFDDVTKTQIGLLGASSVLVQLVIVPPLTQIAEKRGIVTEVTAVVWTIACIGTISIADSTSFGGALQAFILWALGSMCVIPLNDGASLLLLDKYNMQEEYGKSRLWGAVAWGVCNTFTGSIVGAYGFKTSSRVATFLSAAAGCGAVWLRRTAIRTKPVSADGGHNLGLLEQIEGKDDVGVAARETDGAMSAGPQSKSDLCDLIGIFWAAKAFVCVVFACQGFKAIIQMFLFLWLQDLGGTPVIMGLSLTFTCISEPFFFFFAPRLIKTLGVVRMLQLTMLTYAVRCAGYAVLAPGHSSWVLPIELLHGVTWGVFSAAVVHHTSEIAPARMGTRAQGLITGVMAAGQLVGLIAASVIYENYGARHLFGGMSVVMIVLLTMYWAVSVRKNPIETEIKGKNGEALIPNGQQSDK